MLSSTVLPNPSFSQKTPVVRKPFVLHSAPSRFVAMPPHWLPLVATVPTTPGAAVISGKGGAPLTGSAVNGLPWARNLFNLFDYDSIPAGKFANLSLQDLTILGLVAAIYTPETIGAFRHGLHAYETLGRNGLSLGARILLTIFTKHEKFSINSWLLDSAMQDRTLATKKVAQHPVQWLGATWHNWVQVPIQKKWGLQGDYMTDVLKPAMEGNGQITEKLRGSLQWPRFQGNDLGNLEYLEKQRYLFGSVQYWWEHYLEQLVLKPQKTSSLPGHFVLPKGLKDTAVNRTLYTFHFNTASHVKQLLDTLAPNKLLAERSQSLLKEAFEANASLKEPETLKHLAQSFRRTWHLFPEALLEKNKTPALDVFFNELLTTAKNHPVPEEGKAWAEKQLKHWLGQQQVAWNEATQAMPEQVAQMLSKRFKEVLALAEPLKQQALNASTPKAKAEALQALHRLSNTHWEGLLTVEKQKGKLLLTGKVPELLEPMLNLSKRTHLVKSFLNRHTFFMSAQVGFLAVLQSLIVGQLMMVIVFNTFAKLDKDFDPATQQKHNKNKQKAGEAGNQEALSAIPRPQDAATTSAMETFASTWQSLQQAKPLWVTPMLQQPVVNKPNPLMFATLNPPLTGRASVFYSLPSPAERVL